MGLKESVYEKTGTENYVKLSPKEQAIIKDIWSGIEKNPHLHGTSFYTIFLEMYPQYIKFFTLERSGPLNLDPRTTAKFQIIMEAMGYLLLDFHNKPKQLDRLISYIAMVHKDMNLNRQDMCNFGYCLLQYLKETYPALMTPENEEIITRFMLSILDEVSRKMELFRNYEMVNSGIVTRSLRLPCGQCTIFSDNLILGRTKEYWTEWKNQWDTLQIQWTAQASMNFETGPVSSTDEEDSTAYRSKTNGYTTDLAESAASEETKRTKQNTSASRLALIHLAKRLDTIDGTNEMTKNSQSSKNVAESAAQGSYWESMSPRERYRAYNLARDRDNAQNHGNMVRRRVRTSRIIVGPTSSQTSDIEKEVEVSQTGREKRRYTNTARERRRETKHFPADLE